MADKKNKLLIAAIDFGTTHSGYAYSFEDEYKMDPLKISTNLNWFVYYAYFVSLKAPTCVLLSPHREFMAFGYEAEYWYSEFSLEEENQYDYYFFRGFKVLLYETNLSKDTLIRDDKGKDVPALDLFAHVIRYLKNHLLSDLETKGITVNNKDIHWVLPVPAILTNSARQFMREAVNKAGILTEQLTMCLDSEAAALYCQRIPSTKLIGCPVARPFLSFSAETKFMIIDLGGNTNISIYQKQSDGTNKELNKPTVGPWGGTKVDEAFNEMITNIVGPKCLQKFKGDFNADYLQFFGELETQKRLIKPESSSKIRIKLPISLVTTFQEEMGGTIRKAIEQTRYASKMTCTTGFKLVLEADLFKDLFREPVNMLVEHLQQLMTEDNISDVSTLLMVGGFSESPMMQDAIIKAFPDKRVIVPEEAGLAVLKGAVMFGHEPCAVLESNPPGLL